MGLPTPPAPTPAPLRRPLKSPPPPSSGDIQTSVARKRAPSAVSNGDAEPGEHEGGAGGLKEKIGEAVAALGGGGARAWREQGGAWGSHGYRPGPDFVSGEKGSASSVCTIVAESSRLLLLLSWPRSVRVYRERRVSMVLVLSASLPVAVSLCVVC